MVEEPGTISSESASTFPERESQEAERVREAEDSHEAEHTHEAESAERSELDPEVREDPESKEETVTGPELGTEEETDSDAEYAEAGEETADETRPGREHSNESSESGSKHLEERQRPAAEQPRARRTPETAGQRAQTAEPEGASQGPTAAVADQTSKGETEKQPLSRQAKSSKPPTQGSGSANPPKHHDLQLQIEFQLGSLQIAVNELYKLRKGVCFNLRQTIPGPVDVLVNGQKIARGEMIQIGKRLGVRLTEVNL